MRARSRMLAVAIVLLLWSGLASGQSLPSDLQLKLHPFFQALIASRVSQPVLQKPGGVRVPTGFTSEGEPLFDAIITTSDANAIRSSGIHVNSVVGRFVTAQVSRQDLLQLVQMNAVEYLDPGSVNRPMLDLSVPETGANLLQNGFLNNTPYRGKGVIVVIYDSGIDWKHLDFRDPTDTTKSRILAIWDQTLSANTGESSPGGFNYGVEYSKLQIEAELGRNPPSFVRERDIAGHGTHVAGIAAGNGSGYFKKYGGMAPESDIIVIKGGDGSFSESKMVDGLTYAANKSAEFKEPVVVNWSIGGQFGPHDGTRPYEVAVNNFVKTAGRVIAISAGNEGNQNIHLSGTLNSGGSVSISVNVPTYTPSVGQENDTFELDVWLSTSTGVNATVTSPGNISYSATSNQGGTAPNKTDGTIDLYDLTNSYNGNRYVELYVHDASSNVPRSGTWTLTLSGATFTQGFEAWLSSNTVGGASSVSIVSGNSQKTVAMPGTADGAITAASYVTKNSWTSADGSSWVYSNTNNPPLGSISDFSSIGPTGDGRQKPDIAAPGQGIASSLSSSVDVSTLSSAVIMSGLKAFLTQGTSMASPHVAGAAALLMQISPASTASEIKSLLTSTAITDASTTAIPNMTWGYGKLDILSAAARAINSQSAVQRQTLSYDVEGTNQIFGQYLTGSTKYAVRFTPTISGQLTGMQVNVTTTANRPIVGAGPLVCEVWSNVAGSVGGIPGTKLGSTVLQPFQRLSAGSNNFIDMSAANATVSAGEDFHLVIAVSNSQDTIKVRGDNAGTPSNRSSYFDGRRWVNLIDAGSGVSNPMNLRIRAMVTSLSGSGGGNPQNPLPQKFVLSQNYPNPFNPTTTIEYSIPAQGRVRLRVFDLVGREVASLVDEEEAKGSYQVKWRGINSSGILLASGVYFCRLESSGQQSTMKMLLLR